VADSSMMCRMQESRRVLRMPPYEVTGRLKPVELALVVLRTIGATERVDAR